jgi:hypothetical protein
MTSIKDTHTRAIPGTKQMSGNRNQYGWARIFVRLIRARQRGEVGVAGSAALCKTWLDVAAARLRPFALTTLF